LKSFLLKNEKGRGATMIQYIVNKTTGNVILGLKKKFPKLSLLKHSNTFSVEMVLNTPMKTWSHSNTEHGELLPS
jgi:hypothetical protein